MVSEPWPEQSGRVVEDGVWATMQHGTRLARKRDMLAEQVATSVEVVVSMLGRTGRPTNDEAMHLVAWAQATGVPGASKSVVDALYRLGHNRGAVYTWVRRGFADPDHDGKFVGGFPVAHAVLPPEGTPCVYVLLDAGGSAAYIGYSSDVRSRLRSHWTSRHRTGKEAIASWAVHPMTSVDEALDLEGDLIFQHQPYLNRADRQSRRRPVRAPQARLRCSDDDGYDEPF